MRQYLQDNGFIQELSKSFFFKVSDGPSIYIRRDERLCTRGILYRDHRLKTVVRNPYSGLRRRELADWGLAGDKVGTEGLN